MKIPTTTFCIAVFLIVGLDRGSGQDVSPLHLSEEPKVVAPIIGTVLIDQKPKEQFLIDHIRKAIVHGKYAGRVSAEELPEHLRKSAHLQQGWVGISIAVEAHLFCGLHFSQQVYAQETMTLLISEDRIPDLHSERVFTVFHPADGEPYIVQSHAPVDVAEMQKVKSYRYEE